MRKLLVIIAVLLSAGAAVVTHLASEGRALDAEASNYVNAAFPAIASAWNPRELTDRGDVRIRQGGAQVSQLFAVCDRALGALLTFDKAKGSTMTSVVMGQPTRIMGRYAVTARFEKGAAEVDLQIVKIDGAWRIDGFHVNSNRLLDAIAGRPI